MVPLLMLLALYDAAANGVTWPKETCCMTFQLSLPKENNNTIYDAVDIMWHWNWSQSHYVTPTTKVSYDANASANCVTWPEKPCDI